MKKENIIIIAGLYAILTYLHYLVRLFVLEPNFSDFANYYFIADLLKHGISFMNLDQHTVDTLKSASDIPVRITNVTAGVPLYAPIFYAFIMFLTKFGFNTAVLIWLILNNILLVISIIYLMKIVNIKIDLNNLSIISILVFLFQPLIENIGIGQANILILCALVLCLWFTMSSKLVVSGLFMSIAILIKPQYGLIVLLFFVKRLYKPIFSALLFYCLFSIIAIFILGFDIQKSYFYSLIFHTTNKFVYQLVSITWTGNLSFISSLARLFYGKYINIVRLIYLVLNIGIIFYVIKIFRKKIFTKEIFPLEFAIILTITLFIVPLLELHYLVLLYVSIFILYSKIDSFNKFQQYLFVLGYILIALRYSLERFEIFHLGIMSVFLNGQLLGLMIVLYLVFYIYRKCSVNIK